MEKTVSLNRNQDFRRVYCKGKYASSPLLVTYVLKNKCGFNRVGITTSKKIGNAVKRNRARRILRASFAGLNENLAGNFDVVFVARKGTPLAKSYDASKEMAHHLKKLGLIK